jgi:hypothetical protein
LSSIYHPGADPLDPEHVIVHDTADLHRVFGIHTPLPVGTPGADKANMQFRPIFHLTLPDEGKVAADVSWAKIWFHVSAIVGTPSGFPYHLSHVASTQSPPQFGWYDWYTGDGGSPTHIDSADYTCWQHNEHAWTNPGGDYTTPQMDFNGPIILDWFNPVATGATTFTDIVKDAITNHARDINVLIWCGDQASTAWYFICKHSMVQGPPPDYPSIPDPLRWYVEVQWAGAAAALGQAYVIG